MDDEIVPPLGERHDRLVPSEAAELWNSALAQLPVPVAVYDHEARLVGANERMTRLLGRGEEEMLGLTPREILPYPPYDEYDDIHRHVLRTGEVVSRESYGRPPGHPEERYWSVIFSPVADETGGVRGTSTTVFDVTDQHWARRRLAVLNDAAERIGSTLDVVRTAEELAEVAVDGLADFAAIDLLESVARGDEPEPVPYDEPAEFRRAAHRSVLEGCPEAVMAQGESGVYPACSAPVQALATGRATKHRPDDPLLWEWVRACAPRAARAAQVGIHSVMLLPLRARGATLGLAHFLRHRTSEPFTEDDLLLAEEIVARAAVTIDNARRYTHERSTALTLQRSLLPERPPGLPAMEVAYRYLPSSSGLHIGGDWFDAIPLSGARVALVVGDVVGHGVQASATMGRLRVAVRTLADVDLPPDELLTRLDDLVVRLDREEGPDARGQPEGTMGEVGATCLYAVYDPVTRRCSMARAGHPPPVLADAEGGVRLVDLPPGPPLGLGGLPFEAVEIELAEGSLLALYTDGLIETADRDIEVGLGLLRRALDGPARSLEETCDNVLDAVLTQRPADDIALVLARTATLAADQVRTWRLPSEPLAVPEARRAAARQLVAWGLEEMVPATELIVSELVTNAIRYGGAPIQVRLIRDDALICEVSDGSSAAPHLRRARVFDEGGRGLLLVAQVADRWGSRQTSMGKIIWAEQLLPPGDA
ncbi:SpoIIE family protein phosphatase [Sphaerisporangium fuscum]|uniref:SpoIIE family protein phosphatase n=1 Tax=Sphaerisporangium fuscum TaxID=2835868 RepID=UPI001BDD979D|nr:SpoIIE family protein phosphatase [Sphaerisporangium fuscum]